VLTVVCAIIGGESPNVPKFEIVVAMFVRCCMILNYCCFGTHIFVRYSYQRNLVLHTVSSAAGTLSFGSAAGMRTVGCI
jgi:hypothetical protein